MFFSKVFSNNFFDACVSVVKKIEGAYAFAAIHSLKEEIFVARKTSPLVLGLGDGYNIVGSDAQSISQLVKEKVLALVAQKNLYM